jgi:hypothetical protein
VSREIRNARIEYTHLGWEDHGIFTICLGLDYGGSEQGFGHLMASTYDKTADRQVGTVYGMELIMRICNVIGVQTWEELQGKHCRADADYNKIHRLGNFLKDVWLDPAELFTQCKENPDVAASEGASRGLRGVRGLHD